MKVIGAGTAPIGWIAAAVAVALLGPAAGAEAADDGFATAPAAATAMSRGEATAYWTAARIAAARPLKLPTGAASGPAADAVASGPVTTAAPDPALMTAAALRSVWLRDADRYPNRVHGMLVGSYGLLGDFSCSATVVSSRSGSLVTTAGHCVFDAGGTRRFATNLAFIPGFARNRKPYGVWNVTNAIIPGGWARRASLDFDAAMLRTERSPSGSLQSVVGSRGIGFNQSRRQRLQAYGYPSEGKPAYNGFKLIRCTSRQFEDIGRFGGPRGRGIRCDMKQGSSGGGWVAQRSFVVSGTSHGYRRRARGKIFGPYYGRAIKRMYAARVKGWPSIGPVRCNGRVATIAGTDRADVLHGSRGRDVIAALGGNDRVRGAKGNDVICGGSGRDRLAGNGGRDRLDGGDGPDRCLGGGGRNATRACRSGG